MYNLDEEYICSQYKLEKSIRRISNMLGVSAKPVTRILRKNNITINSKNNIYELDENYFVTLDSSEKCYILGLLYADGNACSANGSFSIKIGLQKQDSYILDRINELIGSNRPIYISNNFAALQVTNKVFFKNLVKLGIIPNKTFKIIFPNFIPKQFIFDFIRGVFDGDGYFYCHKKKNKASWSICCNYQFGKELVKILNAYNLHPILYKNISHKNTVEVRINRVNDLRILFDRLYRDSTTHIVRKKKKMEEFIFLINKQEAIKGANISNIINLYNQNISARKIATNLKISRYMVSKILKEYKLKKKE